MLSLPLAAIALESRQSAGSGRELVHRYLRSEIGFSGGDWRDVLAGRAVARTMDVETGQDVSIYGAVRLPGAPGAFVDRIRRIDAFERDLKVDQVGRFDEPPRLDDLSGLTVLEEDLGDLRRCRPGDCELQLSEAALLQLDARVDWDASDAHARVNALFREMIFDTLRAYRASGARALGAYADRRPATSIPDQIARLFHPEDAPVPVPELTAYLRKYPHATLPGAEDLFYWNRGDFGMKPTTRLNHVVIYPVPAGVASATGVRWVIATQQLYANHYFSATLELRTLVEDDAGEAPGFFLLYATRSHVPGLSGFLGGILRPIVKGRARSGMEGYLERTQTLIRQAVEAGQEPFPSHRPRPPVANRTRR